jgi:hypothetical protein
MNRSYSKIRHIQEVNQRLENKLVESKEELINEQATQALGTAWAGTKGVVQQVGSWIGNIFSGVGKRKDPTLTAGFVKLKQFASTLRAQLNAAEKQLPVLWNENQKAKTRKRIDQLKTRGTDVDKLLATDLEYQLNTLDQIISTYKNAIDVLDQLNEPLINADVQKFVQTKGDDTLQTQVGDVVANQKN